MSTTVSKICPLCGSSLISEFHNYGSFILLECAACDLVFREGCSQLNINQIIDQVYDSNWVNSRFQYVQKTFKAHAIFNNFLLNVFLPIRNDLLEIGSGTGEFLYLAQKCGWSVTGIEPSEAACIYAHDVYGLNLINSLWNPSLLNPQSKFDAVVFWHVLEHLSEPIVFLQQVSTVVKPDGLIIFSLPNRNSFTNSVLGFESPLFTEFDHFFHYSHNNLQILLDKAGLIKVTLFSREESDNFANVLEVARERQHCGYSSNFEEQIVLRARLQANFAGHELVCVARLP